ncbi:MULTISPECIES: Glu/Leu/Phe/Val dehydrogenase dimerization domain-containing protein [unclassified Pseudomonas]|uniref:Glu/Leu/Phe/Val family dehydrogenase n=1 Tax=unclassified Pseudomonas TaxID=196821 RepID=UPI00244A43B6|nr:MULTISPECIES: Glu/Leu/Phe/Val dehydrogenase dimerization domain-containing protein [unclassified Pseudomonas]MDG9926240.1 amino acid dehydrogenase [Pseudomonas sp. GD04045]MDH0037345.1 amino acid dehydrogenase [Pseudomonas sp. GD04019]
MPVFTHIDFDHHEQVVFGHDQASGLKAIIAVHDTTLGPALGGCRMWNYASDDEALRDVLRLSRGMTYKSALARLPLGGGKAVIIGDPRSGKSEALFQAMGDFVDSLGGRYITAADSGTGVAEMQIMAERTRHVAGAGQREAIGGGTRDGDPSPATAYGVFVGIRSAVRHRLGRDNLNGLKVAIQGVGQVGFGLAKHLKDAGAELWVTDIHEANQRRAVEQLGARAVGQQEIFGLDVDVFAPCALGAIMNPQTLEALRAPIIAGAANNQLASAELAEELRRRDCLYAPDYAINAGGIIDVCYERTGGSAEQLKAHIEGIEATLDEIFQRSKAEGATTTAVADRMAQERLGR